jgi:hypothetical protein
MAHLLTLVLPLLVLASIFLATRGSVSMGSVLVIKSWSVNPNPGPSEPHIRIVGRASGLISFLLSLVGIDATTTLTVTARHIEYESGSLEGFTRLITPLDHVSTTFYGLFKPWKSTMVFVALGVAAITLGTAGAILGMLMIFGAGLYYFLNRQLTLGYIAYSKPGYALRFKRSVIEGQEINEKALSDIIYLIEHLIKPSGAAPKIVPSGGRPVSDRMAEPAPTSVRQVVSPATESLKCPSCRAAVLPEEVFCGSCGHKLK